MKIPSGVCETLRYLKKHQKSEPLVWVVRGSCSPFRAPTLPPAGPPTLGFPLRLEPGHGGRTSHRPTALRGQTRLGPLSSSPLLHKANIPASQAGPGAPTWGSWGSTQVILIQRPSPNPAPLISSLHGGAHALRGPEAGEEEQEREDLHGEVTSGL